MVRMRNPKRPSVAELDATLKQAEKNAHIEIRELFAKLRRRVEDLRVEQTSFDRAFDTAKVMRDTATQEMDRLQYRVNELEVLLASRESSGPESSPARQESRTDQRPRS